MSCFQGKQNQSLLLEPILNDTKQFHQGQNSSQSAERSADVKEMLIS